MKVTLEPDSHIYTLEDGTILPSLSSILSVINSGDFANIPEYVLQKAARKGSIVHKILELYDQDNLGEYDPKWQPYIDAWQQFKDDYSIKKFDLIEESLASSLGFATTIDRFVNNKIFDIKTGGIYEKYALQTAAHEIVLSEIPEYNVSNRYIVQIKNGKYKVIEHTDPNDKEVFISALNIWKWKHKETKDENKKDKEAV